MERDACLERISLGRERMGFRWVQTLGERVRREV